MLNGIPAARPVACELAASLRFRLRGTASSVAIIQVSDRVHRGLRGTVARIIGCFPGQYWVWWEYQNGFSPSP